MTTIVDSRTVVLCNCPGCGKEVETENQFAYWTEFEGVYCKLYLREVDCPECFRTFYASENGLERVPVEFLSDSDREKNDFTGKMVKFYDYQDVKEGDEVVFTFSPQPLYKCLSDIDNMVEVVSFSGKKSSFAKNLVYLSGGK